MPQDEVSNRDGMMSRYNLQPFSFENHPDRLLKIYSREKNVNIIFFLQTFTEEQCPNDSNRKLQPNVMNEVTL